MAGRRRTPTLLAVLALVAAVATPTRAQSEPPTWLETLNLYRSISATSPVTEDAGFTAGALAHARYVVEEDHLTTSEDPASPWFTEEGDAAAAASVQLGFPGSVTTDEELIETWMSNAFTAPMLTTPLLLRSGFGSYRDGSGGGFGVAGVLDVRRGIVLEQDHERRYPVFWPGNGSTVSLTTAFEAATPDPLTACPGYSAPAGLPLSVQLPVAPDLTSASLLRDGQAIEHCVIDADSYTNPDASAQERARELMKTWRFAVLIPRDPLVPGSTYTASVVADGTELTWSFTVSTTNAAATTTVTGTPGDDILDGTEGDDSIYSLGGDDVISAHGGDDLAHGDPGSDRVRGNIGADLLFGGAGPDRVSGGRGNDIVNGGKGDDVIKGRGGKNKLVGGPGIDTCISTNPKDTFQSCEKKKRAH